MRTEQQLNRQLDALGVEIVFSRQAAQDFKSYKPNLQTQIAAHIVKRAKNGPLFKPVGIAESLSKELKGFAKIKPRSLALGIVYRPVKSGNKVRMEIIAIGPRNRDRVYKLAAKRLATFLDEMD